MSNVRTTSNDINLVHVLNHTTLSIRIPGNRLQSAGPHFDIRHCLAIRSFLNINSVPSNSIPCSLSFTKSPTGPCTTEDIDRDAFLNTFQYTILVHVQDCRRDRQLNRNSISTNIESLLTWTPCCAASDQNRIRGSAMYVIAKTKGSRFAEDAGREIKLPPITPSPRVALSNARFQILQ